MSERGDPTDSPLVRPDFAREKRKGVPEVILADSKGVEQAVSMAQSYLAENGRAILSRVSPELEARLRQLAEGEIELEWYEHTQAAVLRYPEGRPKPTGGRVGIISAGTSDVPTAEEAILMAREMGCEVYPAYDVGVAGLHRLFEPLEHLVAELDVDVIIVAAGMEGALPSVVSGLVPVPVIGLPTSVGYGLGGQGIAALYGMLQSCSPGLAVVNIDNGIGAGVIAGMIANRAARFRTRKD
ncbi:MAG: nickel pincer cofactor biosynthesis protein LarB [Chloroflexota bacterium]|nr:nickel pincer cofactor biosynthesis protein LarB [Chloroflexota bacterium]